jgi:hypothetical protein
VNGQSPLRLVTRGGECFEVENHGGKIAAIATVLFIFSISKIWRAGRGMLRVSVFRFGPKDLYAPSVAEFDRRIGTVLLNTIRRGFDRGEITLDVPEGSTYYRELRLCDDDFQPQSSVSKQLIFHTAYWLSYRYGLHQYPVQFDSETDLEYLGVTENDIRRNQWVLEEKGLLYKSRIPGNGRPTVTFIELYESRKSSVAGSEQVFPKGTQYEAFKAIKRILTSATREILVLDNYMDDSVLDILQALPLRPTLRLLTSKTSKDFSIAVKKFAAQYQQKVEVRVHQKHAHDRVIVIDDVHFYALGASIKDAGSQLFFLNKIEDLSNINRLRSEFQMIWASANPL